MRISAVRIVGMCAVAAALTFSTAACSGSKDKKGACDKLQQTISGVRQKGMTQVSDPNALAQTYSNGANTMRQEGKDSGDSKVEKAANDAASAMDTLGQQVKATSTGAPQIPDVSKLISASVELKAACG